MNRPGLSSLLRAGIALLVVGAVAYLAQSASRAARDNALETEIVGGFMQIAAGLKQSAELESDPPALEARTDSDETNFRLSWRVRALCHVTSPPCNYDVTSPWDAAVNSPLSEWPCWVYCFTEPSREQRHTSVFAVADNPAGCRLEGSDAATEMIVLMEVANSGVNWTEPGDYRVNDFQSHRGPLSDCLPTIVPGRFYVMFADGQIWRLRSDVPVERLRPFLTPSGSRQPSRETELGEYCTKTWQTISLIE